MEEEIWRDIFGYEGIYQVSNLGRVRSLYFGKIRIMSQSPAGHGYLFFHASKDGYNTKIAVARAVARAFPEICGEWFEGCTVDHISTIKTDNRAENLKVCTMKENLNNPLTLKIKRKYKTTEERRAAKNQQNKESYQRCKEYYRNYQKKYYQDNKEYYKEYYKEYSKNNPPAYTEERKAYAREYYIKNRDRIRERQRKYYQDNKKPKDEDILNLQ